MKKFTDSIIDSFVDFNGVERKFVLVALSMENDGTYCAKGCLPIKKVLSIGWAICSAEDTFDDKLGIRIATGRAEKFEPVMFVTDSGIINTEMVQALLKQEAAYLKQNPERYIPGYNKAKAKHA